MNTFGVHLCFVLLLLLLVVSLFLLPRVCVGEYGCWCFHNLSFLAVVELLKFFDLFPHVPCGPSILDGRHYECLFLGWVFAGKAFSVLRPIIKVCSGKFSLFLHQTEFNRRTSTTVSCLACLGTDNFEICCYFQTNQRKLLSFNLGILSISYNLCQ